MQRSVAGEKLSNTIQSPKRAWTHPAIVDEDVAGATQAAKAGGAETPTTSGLAS